MKQNNNIVQPFPQNTIIYTILNKKDIIANKKELPLFYQNKKIETQMAIQSLINLVKPYLKELPDIKITKDGKPYFKNNELYFNYSHSKNYLAVAISDVEIGIDIEEDRIISDDIANKYLDGLKTNKERLKCWVHKEAYSKLIGQGLKIGLENINLKEVSKNNYVIIDNKEYYCVIYYDAKNYESKRV